MEEKDKIKLKEIIEELESYKGKHTELITIYAPANYNLNAIVSQLEFEKGTASNIKSKSTRKNVIDALERLSRHLKLYKKIPENGLALFAGNISEKESQVNIRVWAIEPPIPLKTKLYRCNQVFVLKPLKEMLETGDIFGLLVLDRKEATFGLLDGKIVTVLRKLSSGVPGKIKAGGQSSQRFERITEGLAKEFYRRIADNLKELFFEMPRLKGIIIGGPGPTKEEFLKEGQIKTELKKKIIAVLDVGYTDEQGLQFLVDASHEILEKEEIIKEKKLVKDFLTLLAKNPDKAVYGEDKVLKALEVGAVDKLLLGQKIDKKKIYELEKKATNIGAETIIISHETDEGVQFNNITKGIAAILRFVI